jgi:integrase
LANTRRTSLSVQKLHDGKYKVRWRELGHARARTFRYLRDAETYDAEVKRRLRLGEVGIVDGSRISLDELYETWSQVHYRDLAPATVESYVGIWYRHLSKRFGRAKLGELRVPVIQAYVDELVRKGVGQPTVARILVVLSALCSFACQQEYMSRNPVSFVKKPRSSRRKHRINALSPTQVESIRQELAAPRDRLIVSIACYAGLRPGEILHLRFGDLDGDRLRVRGSVSDGIEKDTKTHEERVVRLLAPVAQEIREFRISLGRPDDEVLIFPMRDGRPWSTGKYRKWRDERFDPAVDRAGLEPMRFYDCRHACASLLLAGGRNPAAIATNLGHSIGTLLSTYSHVIEEYEDRPPIDPVAEIVSARRTRDKASVGMEPAASYS